MLVMMRGERPLVIVGPFLIVVDSDSGKFSVRERQSCQPLIELERQEHSKKLYFYSSQERNHPLPRFTATICYSDDGIYEHKKSIFHVHGEDEKFHRFYLDTGQWKVFVGHFFCFVRVPVDDRL
jgi:hypothetical protein